MFSLHGSEKLPLPLGFRLQIGLNGFLHLARDVGAHLSRIFQKSFHVVVDVVSGNTRHDLWNLQSLGLDEVFPAYSAHMGNDVLGGTLPGCFQGFEVTKKTFPFIDEDPKLSNVVRQRVCVRNQGLDSAVRTPYPGLPIQLVRVKFFEKVSRDLEETPPLCPCIL